MALLAVRDLSIEYTTKRGIARAVQGVSFDLEPGEMMGFVGESGCGKTTTGRALIRVMPKNGRIAQGSAIFKGRDLFKLSETEMRQLRWTEIASIPQSAMDSLNPVYKVGDQIAEILTVRGNYDRKSARERVIDLFSLVGLDPKRADYYPHEFSGGMKQRAAIAASLALNPSLVIADEPVTALDVIVQHQVLRELKQVQERLGLAIIMITHDMSVVAQTCSKVMVMYAGQVVEQGPVRNILKLPLHPYTMGLTNAFPNLHEHQPELINIEGYPPDLVNPPTGCRFAARCPFAVERCTVEEPVMQVASDGHQVACHRMDEAPALRLQAKEVHTWQLAAR
jgi:peptide/nickel transport system ATP-binding protein